MQLCFNFTSLDWSLRLIVTVNKNIFDLLVFINNFFYSSAYCFSLNTGSQFQESKISASVIINCLVIGCTIEEVSTYWSILIFFPWMVMNRFTGVQEYWLWIRTFMGNTCFAPASSEHFCPAAAFIQQSILIHHLPY